MRHRAVIFASVLTVVLLAGWLRSGHVYDSLAHARYFTLRADPRPRCESLTLSSINGRIQLQRTLVVYLTDSPLRGSMPPAGWRIYHYIAPADIPRLTTVEPIGFSTWSWHHSMTNDDIDGWRLSIPYGFVMALAAAAPLWCSIRSLRRAVVSGGRLARGACPRCGYDLRASPARCPECGVARLPLAAGRLECRRVV